MPMHMPNATKTWNFVKDFAAAFVAEARGVFAPVYAIEVLKHDERQLIVRSEKRTVIADKRFGTVKHGTRVLTTFNRIESIDVQRDGGSEGAETWSVSLYLNWHTRIQIGRSTDPTEASICAAHLSTVTGKKVLSL